jgi:hypothetical protein
MFVGSVILGFQVFLLYRGGLKLGSQAPANRPMWIGIAFVAAGWTIPSIWPYFTPWDPFLKLGISMAFYLLNAYPMAVGYGAALEGVREQAKRRFRKNVDDWLGEWECEPAGHAAEEED